MSRRTSRCDSRRGECAGALTGTAVKKVEVTMSPRSEVEPRLRHVEEAIGYRFKNPALLRRALIHRSFSHEADHPENNEPFEFLGDAVLGFVVADRIVRKREELSEGEMTRLRASLVNTHALAEEARRFGFGECLLLGKGEENTGGRSKPSLLADAFEAVIGAVLLDGGIRPVRRILTRLFADRIDKARTTTRSMSADPKTRLQEEAQRRGYDLPVYELVEERGPDHSREFVIRVLVHGKALGQGVGSSKKRAEQAAAKKALQGI